MTQEGKLFNAQKNNPTQGTFEGKEIPQKLINQYRKMRKSDDESAGAMSTRSGTIISKHLLKQTREFLGEEASTTRGREFTNLLAKIYRAQKKNDFFQELEQPRTSYSMPPKNLDDPAEGYIYNILDTKKGKNYVGSKLGAIDKTENYLGSGTIIKNIANKRPDDLYKTILGKTKTRRELVEQEEAWLKAMRASQDGNMYNLKNSYGGFEDFQRPLGIEPWNKGKKIGPRTQEVKDKIGGKRGDNTFQKNVINSFHQTKTGVMGLTRGADGMFQVNKIDKNGKRIKRALRTKNVNNAFKMAEELGLPIIDKAKFKALTKELGIKSNLKEYKGLND